MPFPAATRAGRAPFLQTSLQCSKLEFLEVHSHASEPGWGLEAFPSMLCTLPALRTLRLINQRDVEALPQAISQLTGLRELLLRWAACAASQSASSCLLLGGCGWPWGIFKAICHVLFALPGRARVLPWGVAAAGKKAGMPSSVHAWLAGTLLALAAGDAG